MEITHFVSLNPPPSGQEGAEALVDRRVFLTPLKTGTTRLTFRLSSISDLHPQSGSCRRKARGKRESWTEYSTSRWVGSLSCWTMLSLRLWCSQKQDMPPIQEDHQARFYTDYRKVADEYDKEFLKKYDEDLNTTLIFVSFISSFSEFMLTRASGRSILCRNFCLYHPGRPSTKTRPGRGNLRPPPRPDLPEQQHRVRRQRPNPPPMDRASPHDGSCPSHSLHEPRRLPPLCLLSDAWQAVAEPLCGIQPARIGRRAQPEQTAKTGRHCGMVLQPCDGVVAVNAAGGAVTPLLCAFPVPLEHQHHRRIGCHRGHLVRHRLLPVHHRCWGGLRELSISSAWIAHSPPLWWKGLQHNSFSSLICFFRYYISP